MAGLTRVLSAMVHRQMAVTADVFHSVMIARVKAG